MDALTWIADQRETRSVGIAKVEELISRPAARSTAF